MAHDLLASSDDLAGVVGASVLSRIPAQRQTQFLQQATDDALSCLRSRYKLPLITWSADLRGHVANLAAWRCMRFIGFNPDGPDATWRADADASLEWLVAVGHGRITPADVVDSSPDRDEGGPNVITGTAGIVVGRHAGVSIQGRTTRGW